MRRHAGWRGPALLSAVGFVLPLIDEVCDKIIEERIMRQANRGGIDCFWMGEVLGWMGLQEGGFAADRTGLFSIRGAVLRMPAMISRAIAFVHCILAVRHESKPLSSWLAAIASLSMVPHDRH